LLVGTGLGTSFSLFIGLGLLGLILTGTLHLPGIRSQGNKKILNGKPSISRESSGTSWAKLSHAHLAQGKLLAEHDRSDTWATAELKFKTLAGWQSLPS